MTAAASSDRPSTRTTCAEVRAVPYDIKRPLEVAIGFVRFLTLLYYCCTDGSVDT